MHADNFPAPDDEMIDEAQVDRPGDRGNVPRERDILGARLGGSRRMVMGEDDALGPQIEGARQEVPQIAIDMAKAALGENFIAEIVIVGIDERRMQTLGRGLAQDQPKIVAKRTVGRRNPRPLYLFAKTGKYELPCGQDRTGNLVVGRERVAQLRRGRCQGAADAAKAAYQPIGGDVGAAADKGDEELRQGRYGPWCFRRRAWTRSPPAATNRIA